MANSFSSYDSINLFESGTETSSNFNSADYSLGGVRTFHEIRNSGWYIGYSIFPNLQIIQSSYLSGDGYLSTGTVADTLYFTDTAGGISDAVAILNGETKTLITSNGKFIRIRRNSTDAFPLNARQTISFLPPQNSVIGMGNVSNASSTTTYRGIFLKNNSDLPITSLSIYADTIGTARVSNSGQLSASGSGTIITSSSLSDWPTSGYCRIETSGNALREIVYYSSRTTTTLTIPSTGRGLLGSTAAAGSATDNIYPISPITIGIEQVDTDGKIQTIANETTTPSGVTFYNSVRTTGSATVSTGIQPHSSIGIWLSRFCLIGSTPGRVFNNRFIVSFTLDGVTYLRTFSSSYGIYDTSIEGYYLWLGDGTSIDLTTTHNAFSTTLPFTCAVSSPGAGTKDVKALCLYRNRYGLYSFNRKYSTFTLNTSGTDVKPALSAPTGVTLTDVGSGYVVLKADYYPTDSTLADTWNVYVKSGSDPVPGVDPLTYSVLMDAPNLSTEYVGNVINNVGIGGKKSLYHKLGPYDWSTDLRVLVRTKIQATGATSTNTTATALTVNSYSQSAIAGRQFLVGISNKSDLSNNTIDTTYTIDAGTNTYIRMLSGESQFYYGSTLLWRAVYPDLEQAMLYFSSNWSWQDNTTFAGVESTAVSVSLGSIYLNAVGGRRARFNTSDNKFYYNYFDNTLAITDCPVALPYLYRTNETLFQVFDPSRGRYVSYLSIDTNGLINCAIPFSFSSRSC